MVKGAKVHEKREFDIVVFGATGFTGERVAEYMARSAPADVRWAIGGRSKAKLEEVRERLTAISPRASELELVVADSNDPRALDAMTQRTRVVATTVGPFEKYGKELVRSCVSSKTHYCDITGETHFAREMIDKYHERAAEEGTKIVPFCGFDSIPSDLGMLCVQRELVRRGLGPTKDIRTDVLKFKANASGGTVASIINALEDARDPEKRRIIGNPRAMSPPEHRSGPRVDRQLGVRKGPYGWTSPFLMASTNEQVVRRSNAMLFPDNRPFEYLEVSSFGEGAKGFARATANLGFLTGTAVGLGIAPLRNLLVGRLLPEPGGGPTPEQIEEGKFLIRVTGTSGSTTVTCDVIGNSDPGYGETAKMLGESALCLAFDTFEDDVIAGGVLTPSTAMGMVLVERLRAIGEGFEIGA